jgi:ABC-type transporter Mla MlaB component
MATNTVNHGLLNRMARFIRGQSDGADQAGVSEQTQDSEFNKSALKERIERKRQDDIIRRREFDQLRKLRDTSPLIAGTAPPARISVFQNSAGFNQDDRALTVKKIDYIEAVMSKNWLDRKPSPSETRSSQDTVPVSLLSAVAHSASSPMLNKQVGQPQKESDLTSDASKAKPKAPAQSQTPLPQIILPLHVTPEDQFDFTKVNSSAPVASAVGVSASPPALTVARPGAASSVPAASPAVPRPFLRSRRGGLDSGMGVFSSSQIGTIELGSNAASPELQEAAIRFAEGDEAGAEETLLAALNANNTEPELGQGYCVALFDLYRGTGQQASFDEVAIDFAQRFGKSAPEWFSTPELLGRNGVLPSVSETVVRPVLSRQIVWECPATLDLLAMKALQASLALNDLPKHLNWAGLKEIAPDAAKELAELFARWCAQPVELRFAGTESLTAVLEANTPSSDMRVDKMWWQLRLSTLRILRMHDDFESTALDFCVVYELSPPSWVDPLCTCVHELIVEESPVSVYDSVHPESAAMGLDTGSVPVFELTGEVLGHSAVGLEALQEWCTDAQAVIVSCALLVRVDFTAAGNLLNWVADRQAKGCQIQFRDVPRLVAAFFSVIGIDEHAAVVLRIR